MRKARKRGYLTDFMGESPKARLGGGGPSLPRTALCQINKSNRSGSLSIEPMGRLKSVDFAESVRPRFISQSYGDDDLVRDALRLDERNWRCSKRHLQRLEQ